MDNHTRRANNTGTMREVRHGVWQLSVMVDGQRHYATAHGDEVDARMALNALCAEVSAVRPEARGMTLREFAERVWLPSLVRRGRANVTVRDYRKVLRAYVFPRFGDVPIAEVRERDVRDWVWEVPPKRAKKCLATLRACLRFAFDQEYIAEKPLQRRIELPRVQPPIKRLWSADEAAEAYRRLFGWQHEPVSIVMLGGGLRREEAMGLRRSDVDWRRTPSGLRAYIAVERAYTQHDGLKDLKTAGSARVAVVPSPMAERLSYVMPDGCIAPDPLGCLTQPDRVSKRWAALFDEGGRLHGLPYVTLNQLRHVHETLMVSGGVSPAMASKMHGHSAQVEYGHYLGVSDAAMEQAASIISEAITGLHVIEG